MAKRKQTAAQRKAKQRASYYRREYYATREALEFMKGLTGTKINIPNIPSKITKTSLKSIRKIYTEARRQAKTLEYGGYVDVTTGEFFEKLPTKKEMVKMVRQEQPYRKYRAEPIEAPADFDPDEQYLEELKQKILSLETAREQASTLQPQRDANKTESNYNKNVLPKFTAAQQRLLGSIDYAITKLGLNEAAQVLATDTFLQKIENLEEKYTHEIIESIDDSIIPLIEASVGEALSGI